ncbi:MAG TPA: S8 family serine peptidase [Bryobacteraceae bacterium]|jgi:uncharacterized protein (TIGR03437 family)
MAALVLLLLALCLPLSARTFSRYALLLEDPPAARSNSVVRLRMGPEAMAAANTLRQKQGTLRAELVRRKVQVTGATQLLVNAIYVAAEPSRLQELAGLPGVRRVAFLPPVRPALDRAEQLVNAAGAWSFLGGVSNAGLGVKVAVIDSGIDQTHPAFQDPSLASPDGFPLCQPADCAFTTNKVIVARSYIRQAGAGSDPNNPAADSRPDDFSPRDHQGHGTAVAMIIAGVTNTGPGDTITGFAPRAYLGSYKIFGSPGVNDSVGNDVVILALEDAVKDRMDIANMSLGGPALTVALDAGAACGEDPGVPCDTLSQAVENATRLGVLVVTAAGNDGFTGPFKPTLGSIETPGIAPSAIAVASTTNSHLWQRGPSGYVATNTTIFNTVSFFSSRGPALGTAAIKPDLAAVGDNLFLTAENYDPAGELYSPTRYTISQGTSFSAPMVAGSAALVKQANPGWQPRQIKSALMTTATQDITDSGQTASFTAVGAGKVNSGNAVMATVTVDPQAASFGVVQTLPVAQTFQARNNGHNPVNLLLSVQPRLADAHAGVAVDRASLSLAPGQTGSFTVTLSGTLPGPGSYEGFIVVQGDALTLRIPYMYLVSDGIPNNLVPLLGLSGTGLAGNDVPDGELAFAVIDQYGLPLPNVPVTFAVNQGGGSIAHADATTNAYGIATAEAIMGPSLGTNQYVGTAAGMSVTFFDNGVPQPVISDGGAVNSASFQPGPGIAPGSYISIFGSHLSLTPGGEATSNLPLSIQSVSVSFDVPQANLSVPGHLIYISPQQVNVQAPWELAGQTSVQMKVSIDMASGAVFTAPVADYSPGVFPGVQDAGFAAVNADNPAVRGQVVTLYGTGLGPVNHTPASGDPAPDSSCTTLVTPVVTVAGVPARVLFSGLAPGFAGLYQINVLIPTDAPPGVQPVNISVNGIAANPVQLPLQ